MKITLFAKTVHSRDGKAFIHYIGKLTNKAGEEISVVVRTVSDIPQFVQSKCPYTIEFDKKDANLQSKKYTDRDGNERTSYTLWLKKYTESSETFVDHSLDDFD